MAVDPRKAISASREAVAGIIDRKGIIRAADVNADYTIRPEPPVEIVKFLRTLTAADAA